jgi:hypothetical protein
MYSSVLSLTSALDGVGGKRHAPTALPPGNTRYPLYRRLGGPQGRSGRVRKISAPHEDSIHGHVMFIFVLFFLIMSVLRGSFFGPLGVECTVTLCKSCLSGVSGHEGRWGVQNGGEFICKV